MDTKLRVNINEHVNVVRHNLQFKKFDRKLMAHGDNKFFKPSLNCLDEDFTAILRTPNDMIFAGINDITIRFILHVCIIQEEYK